jgi:hypothetical protein
MKKRTLRRVSSETYGVVQYSGGVGSWATSMRARENHAAGALTLLFADTLIEDQDLYRFLIESAAVVLDVEIPYELAKRALDLPDPSEDAEVEAERRRELLSIAREAQEAIPGLTWIIEGRDPWEVFFDKRFIGNARLDPCSENLKRKFLRAWMDRNFLPGDAVSYIGIDWTEEHRFSTAAERWAPWQVRAPLCDPPLLAKSSFIEQLEGYGIAEPRLYAMGFPHNNCGGFCVKAGMAHFKLLAQKKPELYAYHERREQSLREHLDKDVAVLRDRSAAAKEANGGKAKPLTLTDFRLRLIEGGEIDEFDWGGCGCAI